MAQPPSSPNRLVVVDDSPTTLRLIESVLVQAGYEVTCLVEGAKAFDLIRRARPRIAFIDSTLSDVDVANLCRRLASDESLDSTAIVLMTTRAEAGSLARQATVTDHITKPFTPEALLALVDHLVAQPTAARDRRRRAQTESWDAAVQDPPTRRLAQAVVGRLELEGPSAQALIDRLQDVLAEPGVSIELWNAARELSDAPSLSGDLQLVPLPEVLQALALQRQTGVLVAQSGPKKIHVAYKDGGVRQVVGENIGAEFLLGAVLIRESMIQPDELALVLQNRRGTTRRLGRQVVQLGYVKPDDLRRALWRQSSELVYELLRWRSGHFEFRRAADLPAEMLDVDLGAGVEALLMEGFRRVDEWGLIEAVLPSFDLVVSRLEVSLSALAALTAEERRVYEKVDGRRRVSDIVEAVGGSAFDVARVLYRLISAHVVAVESGMAAEAMVEQPLIN
jgi:DNA-binding response OmpR family regulator